MRKSPIIILLVVSACVRALGFNIAIWPGDDASVWAPQHNLTNVAAIAGGDGFAMAMRSDGSVVAWSGNNSSDETGVIGTQIAAGWCHDLVVKTDGTVWAGGCSSAPAISNVVAAAGGYEHSLVLKSDGTCDSWGWMTVGSAYVPAGVSNVVAIAAGFDVSAALMADGTVANWGYTGYGGTGGNGLSGITAIALGHSHGLALRTNGTVAVWGGTLGAPPVTLSNVVKIGAKQQWACVAEADGTIICWGTGDQINGPSLPITNILQLAPMTWAGMLLVGDGPPQPLWKLSNQVALAESVVKFKGEAVGTEPLSYQWYFNGTNLPGATAPTLTFTNAQPSQAGSYFVVVSNAFGVQTNAGASLTVVPSQLTSQPTNQTTYGGDAVAMMVSAEGAGLNYQWRFSGTNLPGATNAQLTLPVVTTNQAGDYSVVVSNSYGSIETSNATLSVLPIAISVPPTSQSKYVGDTVTFSVTAVKNGPFTYQWRYFGVDIPGETNASLTLTGLTTNRAGWRSVVVSNPYGSVESSGANLNVLNSKPLITAQPTSRGTYPGNNTTFLVAIDGSKPMTCQWYHDGVPLFGANATNLVLNNLVPTDAGVYSVLVSNAIGTTLSSNASLVFLNVKTWGQTNNFNLGSVPIDLTNAVAVAVGNSHSVALKSNGRVVAWGSNLNSQTNVPAGATNVIAIAAGQDHTLALRSNGTVIAWGNGGTSVPAGLSNVIAISAGDYHNMALKSNGTVVAWGDGGFIGSTTTNVPAGATNVVAIAAGGTFCVALKQNGTVLTWGTTYTFPNITNAVAIAANEFPIVILKADGRLVATNFVNTPIGVTNAVGVAAGRYHGMALKSDGTVTNWVSGSPVTPAGLSNVTSLVSGQYHCLAIIGSGAQAVDLPMASAGWNANAFSLSVPSLYGKLYWLEYKNSLEETNWKSLPMSFGTGAILGLTNFPATNSQRLYRVRQW
ncbi:MAG: hypothetical protein RLY20_1626 [Verrucomicrobiota bacterium]|jgi:alpha-tubulin suppressor-like RCC1 family protein